MISGFGNRFNKCIQIVEDIFNECMLNYYENTNEHNNIYHYEII